MREEVKSKDATIAELRAQLDLKDESTTNMEGQVT